VTAVLMNMMAVDPRGQDTATVVIAVGTGTTNLALGKPLYKYYIFTTRTNLQSNKII
jgi:hypothetical protein